MLNVGLASDGYFGVYGVGPILGRALAPGDHQKGAAPMCLLVADFWRTQFGSDPQVLGKPLNLNGKTCTIIGVMPKMVPEGFRPVQVWAPMETAASLHRARDRIICSLSGCCGRE